MKAKSDYQYQIDGRVLFIMDLDCGRKSVTNDIENVLADITEKENTSMDNFDIIYRDSDGNIDGVYTKNGEYSSF